MSRCVRIVKVVIVLLAGIFLSSIMSPTNGWSVNPTPQFPIGSGSWNPHVPCSSPWIVRITDITDNATGSASLSRSIFNPGVTSPVGTAKRWLTPGTTPPGWVSPGPACTIVNSHGTVALFVELDGVKRVGIVNEDCTGNYDAVNGGTSNGGSFCDSTFNLYDPAVVPNYGTSCTSVTDPTCYGRIHAEIDHDWKAAHYCGQSTTCDDAALGAQTTTSSLIDFQGFVYWDPGNLNQQWHNFNGWEIHSVTAWRQHQTNPALSASFTFSPSTPSGGTPVSFTASASGGTQPYSFAWNFGDGSTGTGSSTAHTYTVAGSYNVVLTAKDSSSPQQIVTSQQTVNVANSPPPLTASYAFSPSSPSVGQSVTLTGSASGGTSPYTFNWNFGDGATGTGNPVSHAYKTPGSFTVQLTIQDSAGTSASTSRSISVTQPAPPDFTISSNPSTLQIIPGSSGSSTITLASNGGFAGSINLSSSLSPSGPGISLSPTSVALAAGGSSTATITVTTQLSTPIGNYTVTITGNSASLSHSTTIIVMVRLAPDFSLTSSASAISIPRSSSGTVAMSLASLNSFSGTVNLSVTVSPSGPKASLGSPTVTLTSGGSGNDLLIIRALKKTPVGSYTVTITATSGATTHTTTLTVSVS